jgi:hypothetical protein
MAESWVKVAAAPDESVALLMDGVLRGSYLTEPQWQTNSITGLVMVCT